MARFRLLLNRIIICGKFNLFFTLNVHGSFNLLHICSKGAGIARDSRQKLVSYHRALADGWFCLQDHLLGPTASMISFFLSTLGDTILKVKVN